MRAWRSVPLVAVFGTGCGSGSGGDADCAPFAVEVVRFDPGDGAGFGSDALPDVVLGPPAGGKTSQGSLDVLSLGHGGAIELRLGCPATDGDGVDLVVYENAFFIGDSDIVFVEPAEIAVSADGADWRTFSCAPPSGATAPDDGIDGCAGMAPVIANADNRLAGDFVRGGGDGFDLASVGVDRVSFVRVVDRGAGGTAPTAGFDLDAVAVVPR